MNPEPASPRIVIVGGGISGLSSALFLSLAGFTVRVLESRSQPGGNLLTSKESGYLIEHGPNSTLQKPGSDEDALGRLMDLVGLTPVIANKRFIVRDRRLVALPGSPPAFLTTKAFSLRAKLRLLLEPFIGRAEREESIAQFVERRLGREFLDYAINPFVSGVYAGDVNQLSVRAATAKIYALEKEHGSLIRGALFGQKKNVSGMPKGRLISFAGGMGELPHAVSQALPQGSVMLDTRVVKVIRVKERWQVFWEGKGGNAGIENGDMVVLSTPASETARILEEISSDAARLLSGIHYPPILSITMGYKRSQVGHPMDGFGFLVPRKEPFRTLGSLFSSTLFAGRAPEDHVLLTNFIGGATDLAVDAADDRALAAEVSDEVGRLLSIDGKPEFVQATRYREAIPQYTMGHLQRLQDIDQALAGEPDLYLRCNWSGGISVGDCVKNGEMLARNIIESTQQAS